MRHNGNGFTLVEALVALGIFILLISGIFLVMSAGQGSWVAAERNIELRENIRQIMNYVSNELRDSGRDGAGNLKVTFGAGLNGSDTVRFSVPIVCEAGGSLVDDDANVAVWGAPLTWGCKNSTCMDADNDCDTRDYLYVEYAMTSDNELVRRVLDESAQQVREDLIAPNVTDFQASIVNTKIVRLSVTCNVAASNNRVITDTQTFDILLRNF